MNRKILTTKNAPSAIGPYSQGISASNLIFTSGQLPLCPKTGKLEDDIAKATAQCIKNIEAILLAAGSSLAHIVKTTVYLDNMQNFAKMNEVYTQFLGDNPPARTCFEVSKLPLCAKVEIEAIAVPLL